MAEIIDIVDENGIPTGETVVREVAHEQGIRHRTSHVWLLRHREGTLQVLLQKRSPDKDSFPNQWDISSAGHIPAGDDWKESAIRELSEELGLTVDENNLIDAGLYRISADDVFHGKSFHDRQVSRIFLLFSDLDESAFKIQKEELSEIRWFDLDAVIADVRIGKSGECLEADELEIVRERANLYYGNNLV